MDTDPMPGRQGQTRADFERQRDRFLGEDEIAYRFERAVTWLRGGEADVAAGVTLAIETLAYDPCNVAMHRELAVACARAGDAEGIAEHLSVCFDMEMLDAAAMLADPSLRGVLTERAFEEIVGRVEKECTYRTRFKDVRFDEVMPHTHEFGTTLVWKDEDHRAVTAAFEKLFEAADRQSAMVGRSQLGFDEEQLKSPFELNDRLLGGSCCFGTVHQFFRDIAPYLDDVRFLMFDQVSPVDEVWIVNGAFHMCRHPLIDSDQQQRAVFFEELIERHGLDDSALRKYIAVCWSSVAHISLEANEARRSYADGTGAEAEHAIQRLLALGDSPDFFQARLALFRRDFAEATRYLERTVEAAPSFREAIVMLARRRLDDGRWEDVIDLVERATELNPKYRDDCQLWRAIALESLGRVDEPAAAYLRHTTMHTPARLLEDGAALLQRGLHASARLVYEQLRDAASREGLAAELGLARCAIASEQPEVARAHFERVLERGPALRAANASDARLIAAIERLEFEALEALTG